MSTDSSRGPDALFGVPPDDGRNLRASSRKPGLLAVLGLRVPALPVWIGALLLLGAIGLLAWDGGRQPSAPSDSRLSTMQSATINSRPEGVAVSVDGVFRGTTPLKLTLPVGEHLLKVQQGEDSRSIPISVEWGTDVSQFIDFGPGQSAQVP